MNYFTNLFKSNRSANIVPPGAEKAAVSAPAFNIADAYGKLREKDMRARIKVPYDYLTESTTGIYGELGAIEGIVFPYTPTINYDVKADYQTINPMHGNYSQYFYQHSSVGPISITGKFTVQNDRDAGVYLATVHLIKALTKMKFGTDSDAGSPPPVCRLFAYGTYMMENVPIVISSYRCELPDGVDYYTLGKNKPDSIYDQASVPIVSNIAITCYPIYSRKELAKFSVDNWLNAYSNNSKYL